jgi:uncharacterized membrane protein (UPF0182 family)
MMKQKRLLTLPTVISLALTAAHVAVSRILDVRMHNALGYGAVFARMLTVQLSASYLCALLFAALSVIAVSSRRSDADERLVTSLRFGAAWVGWILGYGLGRVDPTAWMLFFVHAPFHRTDPIFHVDLAFYVYQLPILTDFLVRLIIATLYFCVLRIVAAAFLAKRIYDALGVIRSVLFLSAVVFVATAARELLGRYILTYSAQEGNFLYGPGFTDTHFVIPVAVWFHTGLALAAAAVFVASGVGIRRFLQTAETESGEVNTVFDFRRLVRRVILAMGSWGLGHGLTGFIAAAINALYVHPNQATVEAPYIQRTITATRWALGIDNVKTVVVHPNPAVDAKGVVKDTALLKNVRINDIGQTQNIYNQLQSFKSYFTFTPASVDRYDGQVVYIDARQLDATRLPVKTWMNQVLVYTHGYGIVASPVNQFDADGLPALLARDMPQVTSPPIPRITRPEIYFGTMAGDVIAPSKQPEFDYPQGSLDHTSHYQGGYGLPIMGNRWLLFLNTGSTKYLTSDQFVPASELLFDRNIYNRVQDIAPFLVYDHDAYPFVDSQGHIEWLLDAYTETANIPYAQSFGGVSYMRNSVKVVMDAYTGKTTFYVVDPSDPMIQSLMRLYPNLFVTQIPADVRAHFRYPTALFSIQAQALARYHMTSPGAFYNQLDLWQQAEQIYNQNQTSPLPPVYQMVRLPDRTAPSFVLSVLYTPAQRLNLNGWLVADNDPGHYGQITLYQFPEGQLAFGPMQAENQIDSDPNLSAQLTLWNQQGSRVIRGDLLLVPLGNTILYAEPIYLLAERQGSLPQLQKVAVDYNMKVYVGSSLGDALNMMLKDVTGTAPLSNVPPSGGTTGRTTPSGTQKDLASLATQAAQWLDKYRNDTMKGNFAAAGQDLDQLDQVIHDMASLASLQKK